jgi:hypothetical protein
VDAGEAGCAAAVNTVMSKQAPANTRIMIAGCFGNKRDLLAIKQSDSIWNTSAIAKSSRQDRGASFIIR